MAQIPVQEQKGVIGICYLEIVPSNIVKKYKMFDQQPLSTGVRETKLLRTNASMHKTDAFSVYFERDRIGVYHIHSIVQTLHLMIFMEVCY